MKPRLAKRHALVAGGIQPSVADGRSSSTNGWEFQPSAPDGRSSSTNGWEFQPSAPDGRSSTANGWGNPAASAARTA
jgi:hypothetical protein